MNAYFKQVYRGFLNCKKCLLLAFVPLALYLLVASFWTDRFVVSMPLTIGPDTPLADSADSAAVHPFREVLARPDVLFEDDLVLLQLSKKLHVRISGDAPGGYLAAMRPYLGNCMSLKDAGGGRAQLACSCSRAETGAVLVRFFADQILKQAQEAQARGPAAGQAPTASAGVLETLGERALWRPERLKPAFSIFGVSLLLVLAFILAFEWADPSLKSERQTARYTELQVFGSIPNLEPLSRKLEARLRE